LKRPPEMVRCQCKRLHAYDPANDAGNFTVDRQDYSPIDYAISLSPR